MNRSVITDGINSREMHSDRSVRLMEGGRRVSITVIPEVWCLVLVWTDGWLSNIMETSDRRAALMTMINCNLVSSVRGGRVIQVVIAGR